MPQNSSNITQCQKNIKSIVFFSGIWNLHIKYTHLEASIKRVAYSHVSHALEVPRLKQKLGKVDPLEVFEFGTLEIITLKETLEGMSNSHSIEVASSKELSWGVEEHTLYNKC